MNISVVFEDTHISGVNRRALTIVDSLSSRGHDVTLVTSDEPLTWRGTSARWVFIDEPGRYATDDVLVRADDLAEFGVVDDDVYRDRVTPENTPLRVLVSGASDREECGVSDAYGAIAHARWFHQVLDLVRVSPWAPSREEPLDSVHEFHVALRTDELTRLLHTCDVAVIPVLREHRFSSALAEALASGIPCVATSTPLNVSFGAEPDYALFAPERNPVELGEKLIELVQDAELRERLRARARNVAQQWRVEKVIARVEEFLRTRANTEPPSTA